MKHEITIPIYRINFFCTDKVDSLVKRIQKDVEDYSPTRKCFGRCVMWQNDEQTNIGIFAKKLPALAHECVHAANEVFDLIGQKPDLVNDECHAYLVEWFVREFIDNIKLEV